MSKQMNHHLVKRSSPAPQNVCGQKDIQGDQGSQWLQILARAEEGGWEPWFQMINLDRADQKPEDPGAASVIRGGSRLEFCAQWACRTVGFLIRCCSVPT